VSIPLGPHNSIIDAVTSHKCALYRARALNPSYTKASVLGLNSTILESPKSLVELSAEETPNYIAQGIKHKSVSQLT